MSGGSDFNQAIALQRQGRHHEAKKIYESILIRSPNNVDALHLLGVVFLEIGDASRAEALIAKAIELKRNQPEFHCNYGLVMRALGKIADSLGAYDIALRIQPRYVAAHINRAVALQDLGRYEEALASFDRAIALQPMTVAYSNRGILRRLLRKPHNAIEDFRKAIALDPGHVESHWSMSLALLDMQEFSQGWLEHEWRLLNPALKPNILKTDVARWSPSISAKRLLVYAEQGIGDQVFFSAALQRANALAEQVILRCDDRLVPIMQRSFPSVEVRGVHTPLSSLRFDTYLELGSLFWALENKKIGTNEVPKGGYLKADQELTNGLRRELNFGGGRLCGVSWRSQRAPCSAEKSMTLYDMLPVLRDPGTIYVNLQYGDVKAELKEFREKTGVHIVECETINNFTDLDGHAALINACDSVISGSNSTAHLVGALGSAGHVAIPYARGIFFYWMPRLQRRSYWYPTVHLYDQLNSGDWGSVMRRISEAKI